MPIWIVVTPLSKIDSVVPNDINQPMFLSNSARPNAWSKKFKRFRFTNTPKRISHYRLY